jgi:hypothetical protein
VIFFFYYWYSALGLVWTGTRAQSGDWYGSGMLHPGQVLRGSLPLLSPFVMYLNVICAILFNHLSTPLTAIFNSTAVSRKVKFTVEQATKAQRGSLLFL